MSIFDLIILAILAALTLRGVWKGMISQIVSVASFFVCWIVATRFGGLVAPTIPVEAPWDQVLAMAIVFLVTLVAVRFAHAALEKLIKHWRLQKLNALFGGLLGFTKGLLLCLIMTFFAVMLSETSRAVVFHSLSGYHLVALITRISVFVPKDSYEFVHTQFAQFQHKVDEAVPGQVPETIRVQSSDTMQQMLAQLQQTKETPVPNGANSLWSALSALWNGSKNSNPDSDPATRSDTAETPAVPVSSAQNSVPERQPVTPYSAPPLIPQNSAPQNSASQGNHVSTDIPQTATTTITPLTKTTVADEFFVARSSGVGSSPPVPQQAATQEAIASPPSQETLPLLSALAPLSTLTPLTESLAMPAEELLPFISTMPTLHHVGSERLLQNSTLLKKSPSSASVFRP